MVPESTSFLEKEIRVYDSLQPEHPDRGYNLRRWDSFGADDIGIVYYWIKEKTPLINLPIARDLFCTESLRRFHTKDYFLEQLQESFLGVQNEYADNLYSIGVYNSGIDKNPFEKGFLVETGILPH